MKRLAALQDELDATRRTSGKIAALVSYFEEAAPEDAAWAVFFLSGKRLKGLLSPAELASCALEATGLPGWLLAESFAAVGDFAETIALLLETRGERVRERSDFPLSRWVEERLLPLRFLDAEARRRAILDWWRELAPREVHLLGKLVTGELRLGVSATLVARALAKVAGVEPETIAARLAGSWEPSRFSFEALVSRAPLERDPAQPYPFCLSSPLDAKELGKLGEPSRWLVEWKWDGIRAQLVRRGEGVHLWTRGEELVTDRFPEIRDAARSLPAGTVLDGEVLVVDSSGKPRPFSVLQTRIGRKKLTPRLLAKSPAIFIAFDVLEESGLDARERPLRERRERLERIVRDAGEERIRLSPSLSCSKKDDLAALRDEARARGVEGIVLKRLDSTYRAGRKRGEWWKWKVDPFTVDAVLVLAEPGHGRRATLFTDFTFACWEGEELVPVAKAYSGLTDEEIDRADRWIREHTLERRGAARVVEPVLVFEIAFERIARSRRHASGVALRFPRIARWRHDKRPRDADTLEILRALLPEEGARGDGQATLFPE